MSALFLATSTPAAHRGGGFGSCYLSPAYSAKTRISSRPNSHGSSRTATDRRRFMITHRYYSAGVQAVNSLHVDRCDDTADPAGLVVADYEMQGIVAR